MSKLPSISGKKCVINFGKIWLRLYRGWGSHITLVHESPPNQITVPLRKELDRGTLKAILRQTEISLDEFLQKL